MFVGSEKPTERQPQRLFFKHVLRKVFLEDWAMKLIALAITFALWLGVTGLSTPTTRRLSGVPLTLLISNNSEITNSPLREIDVVVSGDKRKVDSINSSEVTVSVDLSDIPAGDRVIQLSPQNVSVSLPTGVKLEEIQPSRIAVRLETVEEKEIPVQVETDGSVAPGSEVYSMTALPANVRVRGPASFIKGLNFVATEKVDLTNRNTDFTSKQVPVSVSNPKATVLETVVDVAVRIGERRVERTFHLVKTGGRSVTFTILGPRSLIAKARPEDFRIEMIKDDAGNEVPRIILPETLQDASEIKSAKVK